VEHDDAIIGGEPDIAFDPSTRFERRCEGDQAVLGKARAIVKPAVGEALGSRVERVRL
jgi:hypothetical protein